MKREIREVRMESGSCIFTIQYTEGSDDKEIQIWSEDGEVRVCKSDMSEFIEQLK